MAIENLMTFDEIQRTALIGVIVAIPMLSGLMAVWFFMAKPIIEDMRKHIKDLRETVNVLIAQKNE